MKFGSVTTGIIADGLVFNMDAANRASTIPSTSTTKTFNTVDLTQSGSFINDTFYDSSTITPSFAFDGTGDDIQVSNPIIFTDFTVSFTYKQSGAAGAYEPVVGRTTIDGGILTSIVFASGVLSFKNRPGSWTALNTTSASNTSFKWHCVTYDSTANELKGYCNGVLEVTTTPDFGDASGNEQSFNRIGSYYNTYYLDGNLGFVRAYNRTLSSNEVLHNYNALKGRFGLT